MKVLNDQKLFVDLPVPDIDVPPNQTWHSSPEIIGTFSSPSPFPSGASSPVVNTDYPVYRQVIPLNFATAGLLPTSIDAMGDIDIPLRTFNTGVIPRMLLKADTVLWYPVGTTHEFALSNSNLIVMGNFNLTGQFYLRWNRSANNTAVTPSDHIDTTYLRFKGIVENITNLNRLRQVYGYLIMEFVA
jgi:hypothetical protein